MLTCPPGSMESVSCRTFCSRKKEEFCVPSAVLCVVEAFGGYTNRGRSVKATKIPIIATPSPFCSSIFGRRFCSLNPRATLVVCAICPSAFAVRRHFVAFPVLGLQVKLHQPPTQEVTRDVSCARLARARAPASCSTKDSAAGPMLRMETHGLRMPSLTCSSMTTSLSDLRRSWASQKWPAAKQRRPALLHVSLEMAVGTLVACGSVGQILTCLLGSSLSFACGRTCARGLQPAFGIASVS